tara:strand:- start:113 stop:307 length:195 start_codon:yes stop_codon:yes gene_type:complete
LEKKDDYFINENKFIMNFFKELFIFLRSRKKYWLWPIILLLFFIGGLLVVSSGSSLTPFIYAIF